MTYLGILNSSMMSSLMKHMAQYKRFSQLNLNLVAVGVTIRCCFGRRHPLLPLVVGYLSKLPDHHTLYIGIVVQYIEISDD